MDSLSQSNDSLPTRGSLLSSAIASAPKAWHELVTLYEPRLRRWCRGRGLDEIAACDVIQDVWMSVATGLASFRSRPGAGAFRAWLYQIARRRIADYCRRRGSAPPAVGGSSFALRLAEFPNPGESPDGGTNSQLGQSLLAKQHDAIASDGIMKQVMVCVEREVDRNTWQAFWMCFIDQRSTNDVATTLSMTPANVRQCRSRVLRRLRRAMSELES